MISNNRNSSDSICSDLPEHGNSVIHWFHVILWCWVYLDVQLCPRTPRMYQVAVLVILNICLTARNLHRWLINQQENDFVTFELQSQQSAREPWAFKTSASCSPWKISPRPCIAFITCPNFSRWICTEVWFFSEHLQNVLTSSRSHDPIQQPC